MTSLSYTPPFANSSLSSSIQSDSSDTEDARHSDVILKDVLAPHGNKFKLCHLNAHSMRPPVKFLDFSELFTGSGLDVICVTETWLDSSIPDSEIFLRGYRIVRNDRQDKSGGGVAIYYNNSFQCKVLASSPPSYSRSPEFLIVELTVNSCPILVAVVYHPPRAGTLNQFEVSLELFLPHYTHRFICGDFNCNLLSSSTESSNLRSMFSSLNLNLLPFKATHRTSYSSSLLDLIAVSDLFLLFKMSLHMDNSPLDSQIMICSLLRIHYFPADIKTGLSPRVPSKISTLLNSFKTRKQLIGTEFAL